MSISRVISIVFYVNKSGFKINYVMCFPKIHKTLISTQRLAVDKNVSINFNKNDFLVNDLKKGHFIFWD